MVWSDPEDVESWTISPRGAGWLFGSKVTYEFMEINDLKLICRAHQLVHEGIYCYINYTFIYLFLHKIYSILHNFTIIFQIFFITFTGYRYMFNDKLVTVWSAPNYCYRCGNVASILQFTTVDQRNPVLFQAVPDSERVIPPLNITPYFL